MRHLDGVALHRVHHAGRRHDLAAGKDLDLELAVRHLADGLGEALGAAIDRIQPKQFLWQGDALLNRDKANLCLKKALQHDYH